MTDILKKICAVKVDEVAVASADKPLSLVRSEAEAQPGVRDFVAAIRARQLASAPRPLSGSPRLSPG